MSVFFLENIEVILIPIWMNVPLLQLLANDTTRLIDMPTVVVFALSQIFTHFGKIVRKLMLFNIQNPKLFDPRSINQIPSTL